MGLRDLQVSSATILAADSFGVGQPAISSICAT
jgi:hypothetical protein